jgi:hypothetical protein
MISYQNLNQDMKIFPKGSIRCKLNEDIPHPPLVSPMLEKFTLWKTHMQEQEGKVNKEVVASKEYISLDINY